MRPHSSYPPTNPYAPPQCEITVASLQLARLPKHFSEFNLTLKPRGKAESVKKGSLISLACVDRDGGNITVRFHLHKLSDIASIADHNCQFIIRGPFHNPPFVEVVHFCDLVITEGSTRSTKKIAEKALKLCSRQRYEEVVELCSEQTLKATPAAYYPLFKANMGLGRVAEAQSSLESFGKAWRSDRSQRCGVAESALKRLERQMALWVEEIAVGDLLEWGDHRIQHPFILKECWGIEELAGRGKGAVATQAIEIDSLLLHERPLAIGRTLDELLYNLAELVGSNRSLAQSCSDRHAPSLPYYCPELNPYDANYLKGMLDNNAFTIENSETDIKFVYSNSLDSRNTTANVEFGFFPLASRFNHSCDPNCFRVFYNEGVTIRAGRPILPGEELTISYVSWDMGYEERQAALDLWGFKCNCERCDKESRLIKNSDLRKLNNKVQSVRTGIQFTSELELLTSDIRAAIGRYNIWGAPYIHLFIELARLLAIDQAQAHMCATVWKEVVNMLRPSRLIRDPLALFAVRQLCLTATRDDTFVQEVFEEAKSIVHFWGSTQEEFASHCGDNV